MTVEVVAIGDEVLSGLTVNTNASFISLELFKAGILVHGHRVLPDETKAMKEGLQEALQKSKIVICTGGLGPTCDDRTRQVAAELFGCSCEYREELASRLKERFEKLNPQLQKYLFQTLQDQATVPSKAKIIPNPNGSAYGLILRDEKSVLILMPGVPVEMKPMFTDHVLPYVLQILSPQARQISRFIHFCDLPESAVDPLLRELQTEFPALEFGIYPTLGVVSVHVKTKDPHGEEKVEAVIEKLRRAFESHAFFSPSGKIEEAVHFALIEKKKTLSLAESCTGGALAAALTRFPGASAYFLGSFVSYSNAMKIKALGVSEELLSTKGAVSPEVVQEMLLGALKQTESDYAIAVTGIAGPSGGTPEKPVGTVWAAVGERHKEPEVFKIQTHGHREMIIMRSVMGSLSALWRMLQKCKMHNAKLKHPYRT